MSTRHQTLARAGSWCHLTASVGCPPARIYQASKRAVPVEKRMLELIPKHWLVNDPQRVHANPRRLLLLSLLVGTAELRTAQPFSPKGDVPRLAKFA